MKKIWNKISFRLLILTAIVFVPVLAFLIIFNAQSTRSATQALIQENQRSLDMAAQQIDTIFEITETLLRTVNNDSALLDSIRTYKPEAAPIEDDTQTETTTESQYRRAVQQLYNHLKDSIAASDFSPSAFLYFPEQNLFYNSRKEAQITDYIYSILNPKNNQLKRFQKEWTPVYLNSRWYILRIWQYNGYFLGAWFEADKLLANAHVNMNEDYDHLFLTNVNGTYLNSEGVFIKPGTLAAGDLFTDTAGKYRNTQKNKSDRYYYVGSFTKKAPLQLIKLLSSNTVQAAVPDISLAIVIMFICFIILIALYSTCIRHWLLRPIKSTMDSMDCIRSGNIAHRIPVNPTDCTEFSSLNTLFNQMMDEVGRLKNELYEGRLERQKIRLEYLEKQIQPHFILNTLNTLYNHTEDEVQKEIIFLMTRYYRFVVNADSRYVQLGQELEHIKNYLKLQKVRYPQAFEYEINCDDALEIIPVPPFLIESFVGNTIKHTLNFTDCVTIRIDVLLLDTFTARIRISDTGEGFDDEILDMIQDYLENKTISVELGVGIRNSIERLRLIYDKNADIHIYNADEGGAVIDIDLALQMP